MASIDHLMFQQCLYHRMRYKDVPNVEFMDLKEIALSRKSVEEMRKLIGSKDMNESGRYAAAVKLTELRMQYHLLLKRAARPLSDTNWKNVSLLGPVESKACDGEAKAEAVMNVPNATVEARTPSVEPIPREPVSTKSSSVPRGESRPVRAGSVKALVTQYEAGDVTRDVEVPRRVEEKKEKSVKPRASSVAAIVSSFEPTELDLSPEFEFYTQKLLFNHALATRCTYPSVFSDSSTCSTKLGCPLHAKCAIVGTAHTKLTTTVPPMLSKSTTHPKPCSGNKLEVSALETSKPTRNAMEPSSSCEKPSAHDQNLLVVEINKIQDSESDERSRIRTAEEEELREFATGMAQERKHVEEVYWKKRRRDGKMLQRQEEDVRSSLLLEETQAFNAFKRSHAQFRAECIKRKQECDRASEEQEARRQAALREAEKQARQLEEENRKHAEKERFDEIRRQRRERFLQWVQEENKDPSRDRKTVLPQEPERTARKPTSTKKGMVRQKAQEVVPKCVASPTVGVSVSSSFTQGDLHVQRKRLGECIERRFQLNEQRRVEREAQEKEESERIRKEQEMARERRAVERRERRQNQKRATQIDPASTPELVPSNQPTHKSKSSTGGVSVSILPSQQKRNGGKHTKSRMRVHESEQQRDLAVKLGLALGCGTTLLAAATLSWTLFFR